MLRRRPSEEDRKPPPAPRHVAPRRPSVDPSACHGGRHQRRSGRIRRVSLLRLRRLLAHPHCAPRGRRRTFRLARSCYGGWRSLPPSGAFVEFLVSTVCAVLALVVAVLT